MADIELNYMDFSVGYFPPWDKYYISNGKAVYLNANGQLSSVVYWNTPKEAANVLAKIQAKGNNGTTD